MKRRRHPPKAGVRILGMHDRYLWDARRGVQPRVVQLLRGAMVYEIPHWLGGGVTRSRSTSGCTIFVCTRLMSIICRKIYAGTLDARIIQS